MPLTDRQIKAAKPQEKDYKLSDEKGLYLQITKAGSKSFRLKYRINGKEKKLVLGLYPDITLIKARKKRDEARKQIAEGIDPQAHKQATKATSLLNAENSFQAIALEWFASHMKDKAETHRVRAKRILEVDLFPVIGSKPIQAIM